MGRSRGLVFTLLLAAAAGAQAETCTLELKRLEPFDRARMMRGEAPPDMIYRSTYPQHFFMQVLGKELAAKGVRVAGTDQEAFTKIVKKESKYVSESPFRGVAKLGGQEYAFALDMKDAKSKGYDRLYFDANHNGDLTDDKAIDAEPEGDGTRYASCEFPRVDVTLTIDGAKVAYCFSMSAYSQLAGNDFKYVSVSLNAGAYREGQITLDGKKRRIVLLDFNSNGLFSDAVSVREEVETPDNELYPEMGDVLLLDPDPKAPANQRGYYDLTSSKDRHQVSKLVNIDGRYYDLKITPAGDKLTLTPSSAPVGFVTSPHDKLRVALYGDQGFVSLECGKAGPAAVPAGQWRLLSYTLDRSEWEPPKPADKSEEKPKGEKSVLSAVWEALTGVHTAEDEVVVVGPQFTLLSANGTKGCPVVKVVAKETVALPFGPPFKPVVTASPLPDGQQVRLSMALVGATGERCSDLEIKGSRPPAPKFQIVGPKDEVVHSGTFGWG